MTSWFEQWLDKSDTVVADSLYLCVILTGAWFLGHYGSLPFDEMTWRDDLLTFVGVVIIIGAVIGDRLHEKRIHTRRYDELAAAILEHDSGRHRWSHRELVALAQAHAEDSLFVDEMNGDRPA
jgi:hypothetical protein